MGGCECLVVLLASCVQEKKSAGNRLLVNYGILWGDSLRNCVFMNAAGWLRWFSEDKILLRGWVVKCKTGFKVGLIT